MAIGLLSPDLSPFWIEMGAAETEFHKVVPAMVAQEPGRHRGGGVRRHDTPSPGSIAPGVRK